MPYRWRGIGRGYYAAPTVRRRELEGLQLRLAAFSQDSEERVKRQNTAEALLLGFLDPSQLNEYRLHGRFRVRGSRGSRFVIGLDDVGRKRWYELGRAYQRYCVTSSLYPRPDVMLAVKLLVEHDERAFDAVAVPLGPRNY